MTDSKEKIAKVDSEVVLAERNAEILKNLPKTAKNENSKQTFFRRYLKKSDAKIEVLAKDLNIKDSTAKAWVSRFNRSLKYPKFKIEKIEKKEESTEK